MSRHNSYTAKFKAQVVMELLSGDKSLNELSEQYHIAPATLSAWHKAFQEGVSVIFERGPSDQDRKIARQAAEIEALQKKVGQLVIERDWLEKKSDEVFGPHGPHRARFQG